MTPAPLLETASWRTLPTVSGATRRILAEETAVALVYAGSTHAVMMATPADLEDFAIGFSLAEGLCDTSDQIEAFEIAPHPLGIELRLWLTAPSAERHAARRRHLAGPVGCGLCGVQSLAEAVRPARIVRDETRVPAAELRAAIAALPAAQALNRDARALHAAAFWRAGEGLVAVREDIGRHNALDKLAGALARAGTTATGGAVLITSRVSVDLVQKAARLGAPLLVAISAPTALAVRLAAACGITLVGVARDDGFEVFTHPQRIAA